MPLVSIIVPNYNHARYLPQRLDSIFAQTFTDYELIILDDASTDNSREIITPYLADPRVRFYPNEINSGSPFAQWNRGVNLARGEYAWIAESDDFAAPALLDTLVGLLQTYPNVGVAYSESWRVDVEGKTMGCMGEFTAELSTAHWQQSFVANGRDECGRYLIWKNTIPNASAVLFRRQVFLQAGGARSHLRLAGDWLTWVEMLLLSDLAFTPERLNFFRHHPSSVREASSWATFFDERWLVQFRLVQAGVVLKDTQRQLARTVVNEHLLRVRLANRGETRQRLIECWRACRPILARAPLTILGVVLRRAARRLFS
jgi:glycosyltransferase involved in cell wall biosynthesis